MVLRPLQYQKKCATGQLSADHFKSCYIDQRFASPGQLQRAESAPAIFKFTGGLM